MINERMRELAGIKLNEKRKISPVTPKKEKLDSIERSVLSYVAQEMAKYWKKEMSKEKVGSDKLRFKITDTALLLDTVGIFGNTEVFVDYEGKYYIEDYFNSEQGYHKSTHGPFIDVKQVIKYLQTEPLISIDLGIGSNKRIDRANKKLGVK